MKILVLGATGLLGNAMFRVLSENGAATVFGTVRLEEAKRFFTPELRPWLLLAEDLEYLDSLTKVLDAVQPQVVVNCTAFGKGPTPDPMKSISVFSLLPQRLAQLCRLRHARLVQIGSDGVFSGARGGYTEDDVPDAVDLYGFAKILGEVREPHAITLRTSIIGPELQSRKGLLEWFLSQQETCRCFTRAIFSGFPTVVLAQVIRDVVIPRPDLYGVYHVATTPISKFDLLGLVARQYCKSILIEPDEQLVIDRSLNADRFRAATGYVPPEWPELVRRMHSYQFGLVKQ